MGFQGQAPRRNWRDISPALAQIEALIREKESRTGAEQKMDSQLIYELKMRRGDMLAQGVRTLATDLPYNDQRKVTLDLKVNKVSDALLNQLKRGPPSSTSYRNITAFASRSTLSDRSHRGAVGCDLRPAETGRDDRAC